MGKRPLVAAFICLLALVLLVFLAVNPVPAFTPQPQASIPDSTLIFVENVGQFAPEARFQVRAGRETLWLTDDGLWLTLIESGDQTAADPPKRPHGVNLKLTFVGANPRPKLEPFLPIDTVVSYANPAGGHGAVPVWGGVRYVDLYPGLNLEIAGAQGRWTWRLVSSAASASQQIRFAVMGSEEIEVEGPTVRLTTAIGEIQLPLLQGSAASKSAQLQGDIVALPAGGQVSPTIPDIGLEEGGLMEPGKSGLAFSTFIGSSLWDEAAAIAIDSDGGVYVTGYTTALDDFPQVTGPFTPEHGIDVFALKLNPAGNALEYVLWFFTEALTAEDYGNDIVVDDSGQAYLTGYTYSPGFCSFFGLVPGYDSTYNDNGDAYVLKIQADGAGLDYCTFLGGQDIDKSNAIAIDGLGSAFVTGGTWSTDFPTTPGAYNEDHSGLRDVFVAKLDPAGTTLSYGTFLGGNGQDEATAIALDEDQDAFVTGWTSSDNFPTTPGAFDTVYDGGGWDAFVLKLNAGATDLDYSTFLGGSDEDRGQALSVDGQGYAFVAGLTRSANFPVKADAFDPIFGGGECSLGPCADGFVTRLDPGGDGLDYSTFIGGDREEAIEALAIDEQGRAYGAGKTRSKLAFPRTYNAFDFSPNSADDAFLIGLEANGQNLHYGTFLGGDAVEKVSGLQLDSDGYYYLAGRTLSPDFPVTEGSYDTGYNGDYDIFVTKMTTFDLRLSTVFNHYKP